MRGFRKTETGEKEKRGKGEKEVKNEELLGLPEEGNTGGDAQSSRDSVSEPAEDEQTRRLLGIIRECIEEQKGRDIVVLDLTELTPITDYFVICSGSSSMHARAISEHIEMSCKKAGFRHLGIEGEQNAKWILIDYYDIVVHIFIDETRWFYNLERLWGDARRVDQESE